MKKILLLLALIAFGINANAQVKHNDTTSTTTKKIVAGKDTSLKVVYTIVQTDTIKRDELRNLLNKMKQANKNNSDSKKAQNEEFDRLEKFYKLEISRLEALLKKTD